MPPSPEKFASKPSEHMQQVAVFVWAKQMESQYPFLKYMHAIPNGGFRSKTEAARFKAEGVKPGICDICLPYPNKGYHGLYVEMKRANGVPSDVKPEQRDFIKYLKSQNYCVIVAFGYRQAKDAILNYILP